MFALTEASISDLNELQDFMKKTWRNTYPDYLKHSLSLFKKNFTKEKTGLDLRSNDVKFYLIKDKNQIIAYAKIIFTKTFAFLDKLYVDQQHQRMGLGKQLILQCMMAATKRSLNEMRLCVDHKNMAAIQFYEKHYFEKSPIKFLYPSLGPDLFYGLNMVCKQLEGAMDNIKNINKHEFMPTLS